MANYEEALEIVTILEGGHRFVDHPDDPGGATKYGVSLAFLKAAKADLDGDGDYETGDLNLDGVIDAQDIRAMTKEVQSAFFREYFWRFDGVQSQEVANRAMSWAVVRGLGSAVKGIQRAVNKLTPGALVEDGQLGPRTLSCVNALDGDALHSAMGEVMRDQFWMVTASSVLKLAKRDFWPDTMFRRANMACSRHDLREVEIVRGQLLNIGLRPGHLSNIKGWLNRVERC
jgi:lysozyme family protein